MLIFGSSKFEKLQNILLRLGCFKRLPFLQHGDRSNIQCKLAMSSVMQVMESDQQFFQDNLEHQNHAALPLFLSHASPPWF